MRDEECERGREESRHRLRKEAADQRARVSWNHTKTHAMVTPSVKAGEKNAKPVVSWSRFYELTLHTVRLVAQFPQHCS